MVFVVKLLLSLATLLLGLGRVPRTSPGAVPAGAGAAGVAVAWAAVVVLAAGWLGLELPVRPAVWVLRLAGGAEGARTLLAVHGVVGGLALLLLSVRLALAAAGHRWAPRLEAPAVALWLVVWVAAMFGWVSG